MIFLFFPLGAFGYSSLFFIFLYYNFFFFFGTTTHHWLVTLRKAVSVKGASFWSTGNFRQLQHISRNDNEKKERKTESKRDRETRRQSERKMEEEEEEESEEEMKCNRSR